MLIVFPYTMQSNSSDAYYCCCWKSDYAIYGAEIVMMTSVPKGISDVPEEAVDDFGFVVQLMSKPDAYPLYVEHKSSVQTISEVALLKTH